MIFVMTSFWKRVRISIHSQFFQGAPQSGKNNEPKPKLFGPDSFGQGGGLPCEGVGANKFGMSLETREIKLFWAGYHGILAPEKFEKKSSLRAKGTLISAARCDFSHARKGKLPLSRVFL